MPRLDLEGVQNVLRQAHRVYLASPWFTPEQMQRMEDTLAVLREWESSGPNRKVYAPYVELLCPPDAGLDVRKKIYDSNVREAAYADVVVAVTDGKDIGTLYELGYAACARDMHEMGSPLLFGLALSLGDRPFNLMLAEGLDAVCKTLDQLRELMLFGVIPELDNLIE